MFTEDKVTEIFCMADDFCRFFDAMMEKYRSTFVTCFQNLFPTTVLWNWRKMWLFLLPCSLKRYC